MATAQAHYNTVLSEIYAWMSGGFEAGIAKNIAFFNHHEITPQGSKLAIDLGSGCGFQAIPLAQVGFSVIAIDIDQKLLGELKANAGDLAIKPIQDDLIHFDRYVETQAELVVCMTDTLLHLETTDKVIALFHQVRAALEPQGKFIVTFRDLSQEVSELDRFIPVRSDDERILTCFLEYEPESVKVHDILYKRHQGKWTLYKSFYRKLRLSTDWVETQLVQTGFNHVDCTNHERFITVIATK